MEKEVVNVLREKDNTHGHKLDDVTLAFIQEVRVITSVASFLFPSP